MSDADVETKFRSCCAARLTAPPCDRTLARLWSLEAQANLKALFDTLVVYGFGRASRSPALGLK